jgi:hypothetical protein
MVLARSLFLTIILATLYVVSSHVQLSPTVLQQELYLPLTLGDIPQELGELAQANLGLPTRFEAVMTTPNNGMCGRARPRSRFAPPALRSNLLRLRGLVSRRRRQQRHLRKSTPRSAMRGEPCHPPTSRHAVPLTTSRSRLAAFVADSTPRRRALMLEAMLGQQATSNDEFEAVARAEKRKREAAGIGDCVAECQPRVAPPVDASHQSQAPRGAVLLQL